MTTINILTTSEPLSIVLSTSDASYGVRRKDNHVLVVLAGTSLTKIDALNYTYTFEDSVYNLEYEYSVKIEYTLGVFTYVADTIDGPDIVTEELSWVSRPDADLYFKYRLWILVWEEATENDKDKALISATRILERLSLYAYTTCPQDLKDAICEIALALLDGAEPEKEFENLALTNSQYSSVRSTYDRTYPMEHLEAGVPSITAWRLIKPYLDVSKGLKLSRVS
jgi:hypothetical protein